MDLEKAAISDRKRAARAVTKQIAKRLEHCLTPIEVQQINRYTTDVEQARNVLMLCVSDISERFIPFAK